MKSKYILYLFFIILILIFLSGCSQSKTEQPSNKLTINEHLNRNIEITSSVFSPETLTINLGDSVTFVNKDNLKHWPASNPHPIHTGYPEEGGCIASKFDACKGLAKDESFLFTFNEKGTWGYHDHLNPSLHGTIIVK